MTSGTASTASTASTAGPAGAAGTAGPAGAAGTAGPDPDGGQLENHWWWRPGWARGTRYLTWHLTFGPATALHDRVRELQRELAPFDTLDLVPVSGLHLTLAGVGHAGEVARADVDRIVALVGDLDRSRVRPLRFDRVVVGHEAVVLVAEPDAALRALRAEVAAAVGQVRGDEAPAPAPGATFFAHVSLAYANGRQDAAPVRAALDRVRAPGCEATGARLSLLALHRDDRAYEWRTLADLPLGSTGPPIS